MTHKTLPRASAIYYAFAAADIPGALAERHTRNVQHALTALFQLDEAAVRVVAKERCDGGAEFQLTAYETDSRTSPHAMAVAAKVVLPDLRATKALAARVGGLAAEWAPGADPVADVLMLEAVAKGYAPALTGEQQAWIFEQAQLFGVDEETLVLGSFGGVAAEVLRGYRSGWDAVAGKRTKTWFAVRNKQTRA